MPDFGRKAGARVSRARESPGVEDRVELQRVHVIACDELEAQLQVLVDDVSGSYAEHEAVVVAEIVSRAADQLDVRRDQVPRYACGQGPPALPISKRPGAPALLQL